MNLSSKKLIIGANSKIVEKLKLGPDFDIISHINIPSINSANYSHIYLFSWSKSNNNENINMINSLPIDKLIFISTIAVFANQFRKQWAKYPIYKKVCEDLVIAKGGRVLRLASVESADIKSLECDYAHTSLASLQEFLNVHHWLDDDRIINLFYIYSKNNKTKKINVFLQKINSYLPNYAFLQIPFILLCKLFRSSNYGYTYDCHRYIAREVMIGYGALGSFYEKTHPNKFRKVIISFMPNKSMNFNGFKNSIIGKKGIGLSAYWHGVLTKQVGDTNLVEKNVLISVARPYPSKKRTEYLDVLSIKNNGSFWTVQSISKSGNILFHFANRIILAAGPIENIRLLSGLKKLSCVLDDDENAFIGFVSLKECLDLNLVKKFGCFIVNCYGLRLREDFFIEVRPSILSKEFLVEEGSLFYTNTTFKIVLNLFHHFSFRRINEAFFNKFGIGFATDEFSVFCQVLKRNAISISCENSVITSMVRERLSQDFWKEIQGIVKGVMPSFRKMSLVKSFDGLHIQGGWNQDLSDMRTKISDSSLLILGSPCHGRNNPFHTTRVMQQKIATLPFV